MVCSGERRPAHEIRFVFGLLFGSRIIPILFY